MSSLIASATIGQFRSASTMRSHPAASFMLALGAVPGIVATTPRYHRTASIPAGQIELALLGCVVMVVFGVVLALIWNRMNARETNSAKR